MQTTIHSVFHPNAQLDRRPTDLVLTSSDHVQFHLQRDRVVTSSSNCFGLLLLIPADGPIILAEDSNLLSIVFHMIYNKEFDSLPSAANILASFDVFRKYGLPTKRYFTPPSYLFDATRAQLRTQPKEYSMEIYIRASHNDLLELAKAASPALLSYQLVTTDTAKLHQIHPIYLHKLYALHDERLRALQQILRTAPPAHPWVSACGDRGRELFLQHWTIQASEVVLSSNTPGESIAISPHPLSTEIIGTTDIPSETIRNKLSAIEPSLACDDCKTTLKAAIDRVVSEWENTRVRNNNFSALPDFDVIMFYRTRYKSRVSFFRVDETSCPIRTYVQYCERNGT